MDILLWFLCSPPPGSKLAHIPTSISSSGSLHYFKKARKPAAAGNATNCLSCDYEPSCKFSAKRIYISPQFKPRNADFIPVVLPDIEECIAAGGPKAGEKALLAKLREDYDEDTPASEVGQRNWYGRCVYEADNDVCDNQTVAMTWDDAPIPAASGSTVQVIAGKGAKTATLHMVAFTKKICERFSNIYGTDGEIYTDSSCIVVQDFNTGKEKTYYPHVPEGGGHGDGDEGLARQFVLAIDQVKNHGKEVADAQQEHLGCSLQEVIRSHAMVFAAEQARLTKTVIDFPSFWEREVKGRLED